MSAYLSDKQISALFEIKNNKQFVILVADIIKDIIEETPQFWTTIDSKPKSDAINKEIRKLINALEGLSEEARSLVNQTRGANSYLFNDGADIVPTLLVVLDRIHAQKSLNQRQQIGDDVYHLFKEFKIKASTYDDGEFVTCLQIIIEACNLEHDAHRLARDTLEHYA